MRPILIAAGSAAALTLAAITFGASHKPVASETSSVNIGGPFQLVDQHGAPVSDGDFKGKPTLIFFGFTYCPEVCPATLGALTSWLKALGPDADKLNIAFVSIDPERDTPQQLALYLSSFDPRIRGLTGTPAQIATIAREYRVIYQKVPIEGGGYTIDHSAMIYMMDRNGRFSGVIGYNETAARAQAQMRALING